MFDCPILKYIDMSIVSSAVVVFLTMTINIHHMISVFKPLSKRVYIAIRVLMFGVEDISPSEALLTIRLRRFQTNEIRKKFFSDSTS